MAKEVNDMEESVNDVTEENRMNEAVDEDGNASINESSDEAAVQVDEQTPVTREELDALRQQMLRVQADFDNFRRRTRQEKEELQRFATKQLLTELLPIVDNFERALSSIEVGSMPEQIMTGLDMVYRQFSGLMEKQGVEVLDPIGQPFDPNLHEAVMQEPSANGQESGIVIQVLQKGYALNGKVLRTAMVKVSV